MVGLRKRHFEREMEGLKTRLLRMGGIVEDLIVRAIDALRTRDRNLAEKAFQIEEEIDQEVEVLLGQYKGEIEAMEMDMGMLRAKIKREVAKKRGFIL